MRSQCRQRDSRRALKAYYVEMIRQMSKAHPVKSCGCGKIVYAAVLNSSPMRSILALNSGKALATAARRMGCAHIRAVTPVLYHHYDTPQ